MKTYMLNAEVLLEWKRLTGKSVADLARLIRVPQPSLSRWMNGKRALPLEAAMELERVTHIPLKRLIAARTVSAPTRNHPAVGTIIGEPGASERTAEALAQNAGLRATQKRAAKAS